MLESIGNAAVRLIALCTLFVVPSLAHAVSLNPHGTGQVLLYPYYTVNGGQATLLSVVNATNKAKALRVAFRESYNGREVMGLNVYVSPYDVWTAAVFAFDNAPANLLTDDRTCTVPALRDNAALPALPDGRRYMAFNSVAYANDGGPAGVERTREGTLEVIELGEIVDHSPTWLAITHKFDTPADCARVREAWAAGGYWAGNANTDITAPGGGLFGNVGGGECVTGHDLPGDRDSTRCLQHLCSAHFARQYPSRSG